jgi:hypothetical protein
MARKYCWRSRTWVERPPRLAYLTNDPECRGMLLSEAQEWLQEARHRGSTLPLLADLILDVTSGEAEKLSSR